MLSPGVLEGRLRRLLLDGDVLSWRCGKRLQQLSRQALARIPVLESEYPAGHAIPLDEASGRVLYAHMVLLPAVEAQPCDVGNAVIVAIHRCSGYSSVQAVTTRAVVASSPSGQL